MISFGAKPTVFPLYHGVFAKSSLICFVFLMICSVLRFSGVSFYMNMLFCYYYINIKMSRHPRKTIDISRVYLHN